MKLYSRNILQDIESFIERPEAILVRGMRRVGKTTLLQLVQQKLLEKYLVKKEQIYFFDLEDLDLREDFNQSPKNLLKYLSNNSKKKYIFIDEIQYLDQPANFLKILVDHYQELKIFTTGSSSLEIKKKIQDSLVGRVVYFQLFPLNFTEFLTFRNYDYFLEQRELTTNQKKQKNLLLEEYLTYGGMPEIVLEKNIAMKKKLLKNYLHLYITKDIRNLTEIKNLSVFNKLAKILASQTGNILNKSDLANRLDVSLKTINRYYDILKYTFLIVPLQPYFSNQISQLIKSKKIFFYDLGLCNALLNNFNELEFRSDAGTLFENFIFLELSNKFRVEEISFFRTAQGSEIDFIVETEKKKMAIEVKYKKFKNKRIFRVFDKFSDFENFVVNLNFNLKLRNYQFIDWGNFIKKIKMDNKN